ncbi:hypothetical protein HAX54_025254 [Datura stramonium]|uniref:Secreted protein n=1 Tax=Datura stramonium TaxID=4076 RepID=A0ABS8UZE3_DATST|nr:hypothetical protein [Datura stramonium]
MVALSSTAVLRSVAAASGAHQLGYYPMTLSSTPICDGSIGECLSEYGNDEEFAMDSESSRRILAYRRRYISYGALSRNRVPCSRRESSADFESSFDFSAAEGDGEPSWPISTLKSLMLCSNSSIRFPISSSATLSRT